MSEPSSGKQHSTGQLLDLLGPPARAVSARAHAPYSTLHVGAALQTLDGRLFDGCNLESASFGLTQCAERNALGTAIAAGVQPGEIKALAIYLPGQRALPPCGACRQLMVELMVPEGVVLSFCDSDEVLLWTVSGLMPGAFTGF